MKRTYTEMIEELLDSNATNSEIEQVTSIPSQTIGKYRNGKAKIDNMSLKHAEVLITYYNNENPLLKEESTYYPRYENRNVKYARLKFAGETKPTVFENMNYGTRKKRPVWIKEDGVKYPGIVDANPTARLAEFSGTEISVDGKHWQVVRDLVKK